MVGTLALNGLIDIATAQSLMMEQLEALSQGILLETAFTPGASALHLGRDMVVDTFLKSENEKLVLVDADVSWERGDLCRLVGHPLDFVGGGYRHKRDEETYTVNFLSGDTPVGESGLLPVHMVPGGFLVLSRNVFKRLRAHHQRKPYKPPGCDHEIYPYFWMPPGAGEDGQLCDEWREAGGTVFLDTKLNLTHTGGRQSYTGCIHDWLVGKKGVIS